MKPAVLLLCLFCSFNAFAQTGDSLNAPNLFIITIDGVRWQELFNGADEAIINNRKYVSDTTLIKEMYWDNDTQQRRRRLLPFLWNVIARKGQIYGNRNYGNRMNVANRYKFSYPGYNEIFTGYADARFIPNTPVLNENTNILEYLNRQREYREKVVAFTSWNIFPFILNEKRSGIRINSGYEALNDADPLALMIDSMQDAIADKGHTRCDELTYLGAREYIKKQHPKVALIAFGEADEFAHHGRYDRYLQSIANTDRMISELWYYVQTDPFYRNNTTFLITTDHGRGKKAKTWTDHLFLIKGSREIWMAVMGPGIQALGEVRTEQVLYQKQIAATIAQLLGKQFTCEHSVGQSIDLPKEPVSYNGHIAIDHP
jgi:hypothetical protein